MMKAMNKSKVKSSFKRHLQRVKMEGSKAEVLLWVDYMMFLHRLAKEAETAAQEDRSKTVTATHIRAVAKNVLGMCRG